MKPHEQKPAQNLLKIQSTTLPGQRIRHGRNQQAIRGRLRLDIIAEDYRHNPLDDSSFQVIARLENLLAKAPKTQLRFVKSVRVWFNGRMWASQA